MSFMSMITYFAPPETWLFRYPESFELVRALTEHLPVMITPRWVSVLAQPIGIQDLLAYLVEAIDVPDLTTYEYVKKDGKLVLVQSAI